MFDFLSNHILGIAAARPTRGADGALTEARHFAEREMPKALTARSTAAEDQVFLSGAVRVPPAPIPLKPSEPTGTGNRVRDLLRRWPGFGRRSHRPAPQEPDPGDHDAPPEPATGHRLDRWA